MMTHLFCLGYSSVVGWADPSRGQRIVSLVVGCYPQVLLSKRCPREMGSLLCVTHKKRGSQWGLCLGVVAGIGSRVCQVLRRSKAGQVLIYMSLMFSFNTCRVAQSMLCSVLHLALAVKAGGWLVRELATGVLGGRSTMIVL
ncbi:unnamed protein product [Discosporangium mesarthrocarpum]